MFFGKKNHHQEYPISLPRLLAIGKQGGIVGKNARTLSRVQRSSRAYCVANLKVEGRENNKE
jgi:hypothetical protein